MIANFTAAENLPFRAEKCFLSVVEASPDVCLAYLVDPEERFPVGVETTLLLRDKDSWQCTDALTGAPCEVREGQVAVRIPAGSFRVLQLQRIAE